MLFVRQDAYGRVREWPMEIERQTACGLRLSLRVAVLTESKRFYPTECLPPTAPPPVFSGV